jgi:hypothetical protein
MDALFAASGKMNGIYPVKVAESTKVPKNIASSFFVITCLRAMKIGQHGNCFTGILMHVF